MTWKCDTCGEQVTRENGYVQWLTTDAPDRPAKFRRHAFGIVHNDRKCLFDLRQLPKGTTNGDLDIGTFLGQDGLMTLFQFMSEEPQALDELLELGKRLHIDGYDEARGFFKGAIAEGVFEPNSKPGFYDAREIKKTLDWAKKVRER